MGEDHRGSGAKWYECVHDGRLANSDQLMVDLRIRTEAELRTTIADYRFYRFAISYPLIKSLVMVRWKLPAPPSR